MKIEKILNEAFSPSMPTWLKNFFLYNTERRNPGSKFRSTRMYP